MISNIDYGDLPIEKPEQDLFGLGDFVESLARSIRGMKSPNGVVIALNGPWGSGKSSAINLLCHSLKSENKGDESIIVSFNPWWFRGEEALTLAFLRELYAATNPSLPEKAKKLLPGIGSRLLKAGGIVAPAADALGAAGAGAIASGAMNWLGGLIEVGESVEKLHAQLAEALREQTKRFVVLIDDIDRLSPDESIAMFRLVKSVGRLPNVIYVLAFDRILAEKVIAERFPSEGPHYLEKIIQASFELPLPLDADLQRELLTKIGAIVGDIEEDRMVHVMNMFHEVLAPEVSTPRDAVRFLNAFSVTWPAVAGEADVGDFLALEAYRVFQPAIYQAIRSNLKTVSGPAAMGTGRSSIKADQLDSMLLASVEDKARYRRGLMRLFPKLQSIWSNTFYGGEEWAKQRRVCSTAHSLMYFRLAIPEAVISKKEIENIIAITDDDKSIIAIMKDAVNTIRKDGTTKAALLLDSLKIHADQIPQNNFEHMLKGIFRVADDINVQRDCARGFAIGDNHLRIHWLMRALLFNKVALAQRSKVIMAAADVAGVGWLVNIARSAWGDHHPREGREREPEDACLVTEKDAARLVKMTLKKIRLSSRDGTLIAHPDLAELLYAWRDLAKDQGKSVKHWTKARLKEPESVVRLAAAFTSHAWSQSMGLDGLGDHVAKRSDRAQVSSLDLVMNRTLFRSQAAKFAKAFPVESVESQVLSRFLGAWASQENGAGGRRKAS